MAITLVFQVIKSLPFHIMSMYVFVQDIIVCPYTSFNYATSISNLFLYLQFIIGGGVMTGEEFDGNAQKLHSIENNCALKCQVLD